MALQLVVILAFPDVFPALGRFGVPVVFCCLSVVLCHFSHSFCSLNYKKTDVSTFLLTLKKTKEKAKLWCGRIFPSLLTPSSLLSSSRVDLTLPPSSLPSIHPAHTPAPHTPNPTPYILPATRHTPHLTPHTSPHPTPLHPPNHPPTSSTTSVAIWTQGLCGFHSPAPGPIV